MDINMAYNKYLPEGRRFDTDENLYYTSSLSGLERAKREGAILEAYVDRCDEEKNTYVDLNGIKGVIPREEFMLTPDGEEVKSSVIANKVDQIVCFKVKYWEIDGTGYKAVLSRREAQEECYNNYLSTLTPGDIIPATVTAFHNNSSYLDIGCGYSAMMTPDCFSISRVTSASNHLYIKQEVHVVVKANDPETRRFNVSIKELLGTWEENAKLFTPGDTVPAYVSNIDEKNGVWIALAPNFQGLAEKIEDDPVLSNLQSGDRITVYIKSINTSNEKVKLVIVSKSDRMVKKPPLKYYIDVDEVKHIDKWVYSPEESLKNTQTIFE